MKVMISYPPLPSEKGVPLLSQNRQFQWFKSPTYIYPVVPAYAATMLKKNGFEVFWDDAIAEELSYADWLSRVKRQQPDVIVLESKTPVIKRHWKMISTLKRKFSKLKAVLVGDHVTALPQESMDNSPVDFILTGGDYDFLLVNLCQALARNKSDIRITPQALKELEPGIWYRDNGQIRNTGSFVLNHDLSTMPIIDRNLTRWQLYAFKNGNFKYPPGTYVMAGRDCWWGKCTFCSWTTLYPANSYRTVSTEKYLDEIEHLIENHGVKEIFDDSGCFPKGQWLEDFCQGIIERGYNKKMTMGCNTRVNAITENQFKLMKKANFRFILIGLESVNQNTLNRLHKGIRVEDIERTCRQAKKAGLEPHLTIMVGYPWETQKDAESTIRFARRMLRKGIIDSLQATIVIPYPGSPLFDEAKRRGWLLTEDWNQYDMKEYVWKLPVTNLDVMNQTRSLYLSALYPNFILHKLIQIRSADDLRYCWMAGKKLFAHLADFR